jgi:macrolide-specific efflux system membrane fusion protein
MKKGTAITIALLTAVACKKQQETTPVRRDIVDAVFASGDAETKDRYNVIANVDGYLLKAYVSEGDTIKTNQPLFRLEGQVQKTEVLNAHDNYRFAESNAQQGSPQIQQLTLQIAQAAEKFKVDSANYERYKRLLPSHAVAKVDYDNALLTMQNSATNLRVLEQNKADLERNLAQNTDNARAQLRIQQHTDDFYQLGATRPGVVLTVPKREGELIRKGDVIGTIGSGRVIAKLYIAEDDIGRVVLGQQVLLTLNTNKDSVFRATLSKIYPSFDNTDQSFIAEAIFNDGPPGNLRDGTQLQANIIIGEKKGVLVIPTMYLEPGDKVLLKDGHKEVHVRTGIRNLDYTEILDGLTEKDVILYAGH